jgi:F-type H+-transporting ATPase subunit b
MEKLIHQFEFGLFVWQVLDLCGLIFLEKICLETILDGVNDRKKNQNFLQKMQRKKMQNLQADNQRILQGKWSVNNLPQKCSSKGKCSSVLK